MVTRSMSILNYHDICKMIINYILRRGHSRPVRGQPPMNNSLRVVKQLWSCVSSVADFDLDHPIILCLF